MKLYKSYKATNKYENFENFPLVKENSNTFKMFICDSCIAVYAWSSLTLTVPLTDTFIKHLNCFVSSH